MAAGYSLSTHYGGQGLLDSFNFFTGNDPSNGFVDYQSREDALANNLVSIDDQYHRVRLGVDSNNTYSTSDKGRPSVRLTSNDAFTHGLFIADILHMPASTCGTWPAFWAFNNQENGTNWPEGGEVEIIEGANTAQRNLFSAHTTEGCQAPKAEFSGEQGHTDCSKSPGNIGCNYASTSSDTTSYGDGFNTEGGGVYALEWDSEDLKLWHFPRSTIPDNIVYAHVDGPDPSTWGPPQAVFGGSSCSPDTYFFNLSLVLNINFCGDYAGNVWGKTDQCNQLAPTCEEFVAGNPDSFSEAYWDINFIDVYQYAPLTNMTTPAPPANTTSASTSLIPNTTSTAAPTGVAPTNTRTITLSMAHPTETGNSLVNRDLAAMSMPPGAPAMGLYPIDIPMIVTTAITVTYTTVCSTNPATLVEAEYVTTMTYEECGCTKSKSKPAHTNPPYTTTTPASAAPIYIPMETCTETCHACGPAGESTVTLTVPAAVAVATPEVAVTAVTVQTVVPVVNNATAPAVGTAALTAPPGLKPAPSNVMPLVAGAARRSATAAVSHMLGLGVALWFGVFGAMVVF